MKKKIILIIAFIIAASFVYAAPVFQTCGDKIIQYPEQCDDGNILNGDLCNQYCRLERSCTNNISYSSGIVCMDKGFNNVTKLSDSVIALSGTAYYKRGSGGVCGEKGYYAIQGRSALNPNNPGILTVKTPDLPSNGEYIFTFAYYMEEYSERFNVTCGSRSYSIPISFPEINKWIVKNVNCNFKCGANNVTFMFADNITSKDARLEAFRIQTCQAELSCGPVCGNNKIEEGEQCEMPNSTDNLRCLQSNESCSGFKYGLRDNYGSCSSSCGCGYDDFSYSCVKGKCNAQCSADSDCGITECGEDRCIGNDYYDFTDINNSCAGDCYCVNNKCPAPKVYPNDDRCVECTNDSNCSDLNKDECEGSILKQEKGICENYKCVSEAVATECDNNAWCDGVERCVNDSSGARCVYGTPVDCRDPIKCTDDYCDENLDKCVHMPDRRRCDDGIYCNGIENCDVNRGCVNGQEVNCSSYSYDLIATCNYDPDANPFTIDYSDLFTSVCDEAYDMCTTKQRVIRHLCNKNNCNAECERDSDCGLTDCDKYDRCIGKDYYDFDDVANVCLGNCSCYINNCGVPHIIRDYTGCTACGNGILEQGEECDDGNTINGDGCHSNCLRENICEYDCNPYECGCREVCRYGQCWTLCGTCWEKCQEYCLQ